MRRSSVLTIVVLIFTLVITGCGILNEDDPNEPKVDVTGVWAGSDNVIKSNDNTIDVGTKISNVTLELTQSGSSVSGTFHDNNVLTGFDNTFNIFGSVTENRFALFDGQDGTLGYIVTVDTTPDQDGKLNMTFSPDNYENYVAQIIASKEKVTISAMKNTADEESGLPGAAGVFMVTRSFGSSKSALTVNFTVSGTATSGEDYIPIGNSVTIPPGNTVKSATILVVPINDTIPDNGETVIVTLAPGTGYAVGNPSMVGSPFKAEVRIQDGD